MTTVEKIQLEFNQRPVDVPADLRLYRRLAMVCISVSECCYAKSASFRQLHFINSLILNKAFRERYLIFRSKRTSPQILAPSVDPYLNRCVNYAIGAALLEQKDVKAGFKVILTSSGIQFVANLRKEKLAFDIFSIVREIGRISEKEIDAAMQEGN